SKQLYLLTGNDANQIHLEAEKLFQSFAGADPNPFSTDIIQETDSGPSIDVLHQLLNSLQSSSFIGGTKTIWLKHFTGFSLEKDSKSKSPLAKAFQHLAQRIKDGLPDDILLIMDGVGCDKRKTLGKACVSKGTVQTFDKPIAGRRNSRQDMMTCINRIAEQKGITLSSQACEALADTLGVETANIETELEKIICYCGGPDKPITPNDIREISNSLNEEKSWILNDPLGQRNLTDTIAITEQLLAQSKTPDQTARSLILTAANFFRQILQVKLFMAEQKMRSPRDIYAFISNLPHEEKKNFSGIQKTIVEMHPYRAQKIAEQTALYSPSEIISAMRKLRDALWQITSSNTPPPVALENVLYQIIGLGH
ncbi:MAG: hypothetical protein WCS73_07330, partial [Lentisphaeria bacterium]